MHNMVVSRGSWKKPAGTVTRKPNADEPKPNGSPLQSLPSVSDDPTNLVVIIESFNPKGATPAPEFLL